MLFKHVDEMDRGLPLYIHFFSLFHVLNEWNVWCSVSVYISAFIYQYGSKFKPIKQCSSTAVQLTPPPTLNLCSIWKHKHCIHLYLRTKKFYLLQKMKNVNKDQVQNYILLFYTSMIPLADFKKMSLYGLHQTVHCVTLNFCLNWKIIYAEWIIWYTYKVFQNRKV